MRMVDNMKYIYISFNMNYGYNMVFHIKRTKKKYVKK